MKTAAKLLLIIAAAAFSAACVENLSEADKSDPGIRARVEANLAAHRELDLKFITLDVHSSIVTVSGLVHSWEEKQLVMKIVNSTGGFQQAIFNLAIQE